MFDFYHVEEEDGQKSLDDTLPFQKQHVNDNESILAPNASQSGEATQKKIRKQGPKDAPLVVPMVVATPGNIGKPTSLKINNGRLFNNLSIVKLTSSVTRCVCDSCVD